MARPRAFDTQQTLATVRELFWSQGFAATSMDDVSRITGVGRQSLYDTFGCKESLFEAALREYRQAEVGRLAEAFDGDGPVGERLRRFFDVLIDLLLSGGGRGCLITNAIAEKDRIGAGALAVIDCNAREVEGLLRDFLRAAQRSGQLAPAVSAATLAAFLFNTVLGLSAMARLGGDRRRMRAIARVAIDAVG